MAWVMWLTGLPGSGKTTIADAVSQALEKMGISTRRLELDEIRRYITPVPTYSEMERDIVYRSLGYMAKLLFEEGKNVIIDATANRKSYRDFARDLIPNFIEVYIKAPLDLCMKRESLRDAKYSPKGIYERAKSGANVPGVNVPYEAPEKPEIVIETSRMEPHEAAEVIVEWVIGRFGSAGMRRGDDPEI